MAIPAGNTGLPESTNSTAQQTVPSGPIGPVASTGHLSMYDMLWISRYSRPTFVVDLFQGNGPMSADDDPQASLYALDDDGQIIIPALWTRDVAQVGIGHYPLTLTTVDTQTMGNYELQFTYTVNGDDEIAVYDIEIGPYAPTYVALDDNWRSVIDGIWWKFADLYDSPYGGPNLQVYVQTHFGRERVAQMLSSALQTLNTATAGNTNYAVNGTDFPFSQWLGLLQDSLYMEVLAHLVRSYVEQPEVILGTAISRVDRRDYMQRWQEVLQSEQTQFDKDLGRWRMANLGLDRVHVLVAGGAYGKWGPTAAMGTSGEAAARGYFAMVRRY